MNPARELEEPVSKSNGVTEPDTTLAEVSVLGGMLIDDAEDRQLEAIESVRRILTGPADFEHPVNRVVYRAMINLIDDGSALDVVTLLEELRRTGDLEAAGGASYLAQLIDAVPHAANIEDHARIVREKTLRRRLIAIAMDTGREVALLASAAEEWIEETRSHGAGGTSSVISLAEMLDEKPELGPPEAVVERFAWRGRVTGIYAREKTGKSTILSFVGSALTNGTKVLGWSPEAPGRVLWNGLEEHSDDVAFRAKTFGTDPKRFFFLGWSAHPLRELELAIRETEPDLVVLDSLAAYVELAAPASGESSSWKVLLGPLTRLARKYNIALVIILHSNKGKDAEYRDSTAIGAEMDMLIEMREGDVPGVRMFKPKGR